MRISRSRQELKARRPEGQRGAPRRLRGRRPSLRALAALVVLIGGILGQAVIERMTDFQALGADEVDALDSLVDALAVEDAAAELFDPDAEQFLVLALDFAAAGFVLGKIRIFARLIRRIGEAGVE